MDGLHSLQHAPFDSTAGGDACLPWPQAVSGLGGDQPVQLFWGLFVLLFQRSQDVPAKDEVTEVDDVRSSVYAALLVFTVLCLIPLPSDLLSTDPF